MVCLRVPTAVHFLQSRSLSCCHLPLVCWKSSISSVLPHNFQWQRLRLFDSWKEWVWMTGKLDGHRHSPGLLGGAFLWSGKVGNIDGEQHRAKARSLWFSSGQLFLNRFRTVTPVRIHIWWWNDANSLMLLRRGALLFFEVIRQISRSDGSKIIEFDPDWVFPDCNSSLNTPMATKWCTKLEVA